MPYYIRCFFIFCLANLIIKDENLKDFNPALFAKPRLLENTHYDRIKIRKKAIFNLFYKQSTKRKTISNKLKICCYIEK